jgi:hypothetical protein
MAALPEQDHMKRINAASNNSTLNWEQFPAWKSESVMTHPTNCKRENLNDASLEISPLLDLPVRIEIVGHVVAIDLYGKEFAQYKIHVWDKKCDLKPSCELLRRFSEFRKLHVDLKSGNKMRLPPCPSRFTLGLIEPTGDWFVKERQADLQHYLDALVELAPQMDCNTSLLTFLAGWKAQRSPSCSTCVRQIHEGAGIELCNM